MFVEGFYWDYVIVLCEDSLMCNDFIMAKPFVLDQGSEQTPLNAIRTWNFTK